LDTESILSRDTSISLPTVIRTETYRIIIGPDIIKLVRTKKRK